MLQFPLTFRNVFDDLLLLLGIEIANNAPMYIRERVINDINAALQIIQAAGGDYFTRKTYTVNATGSTASYALDNGLQQVLTVRHADGSPLRELATRGEYDLFSQVCLGATAANAKPLAYYLQRFFTSAGNAGDNAGTTLFLAPTPDGSYTVTVEGAGQAPNFGYSDLLTGSQLTTIDTAPYPSGFFGGGAFLIVFKANTLGVGFWFTLDAVGANPNQGDVQIQVALVTGDTPAIIASKLAAAMATVPGLFATVSGTVVTVAVPASTAVTDTFDGFQATSFAINTTAHGSAPSVIPMPHRYAQSLLLPIARYNVTTCPWFYKPERLPSLQSDYQRALDLLELNNPQFVPPGDAAAGKKREEAVGALALAKPRPPTNEEEAA